VLIAIISIIAFINFGNQSSKARNAMRLEASSKIATAFQLKYTQDEFKYTTCEAAGLESYILTGALTGTGCNIKLDGSDKSKSFLRKLGISGTFQDPLNKTIPGSWNTFIYEFNYKINSPLYEFVYLTEPKENWSLIDLNKTYALEYNTGSLDVLNIDGNTSIQNSFSPVILKETGSLIGDLPVNEDWIKVFNKTTEITTFLMNDKRVSFNKTNRDINNLTNSSNTRTQNNNNTNNTTPIVNSWPNYCLRGINNINGLDYNVDNTVFENGFSLANLNLQVKDSNWNTNWNYNSNIKVICERDNWVLKRKKSSVMTENGNCFDNMNCVFDYTTKTCKNISEVSSSLLCSEGQNSINVNGDVFNVMAPWSKSSIGTRIFWNFHYQVWDAQNPGNQLWALNRNTEFECKLDTTTNTAKWTADLTKLTEDANCWNGGVFNLDTRTCDNLVDLQSQNKVCLQGNVMSDGVNFNIWQNGYLWIKMNNGAGQPIENWNINYNKTFECKLNTTTNLPEWTVIKSEVQGMCNMDYAFDITTKTCKSVSNNCSGQSKNIDLTFLNVWLWFVSVNIPPTQEGQNTPFWHIIPMDNGERLVTGEFKCQSWEFQQIWTIQSSVNCFNGTNYSTEQKQCISNNSSNWAVTVPPLNNYEIYLWETQRNSNFCLFNSEFESVINEYYISLSFKINWKYGYPIKITGLWKCNNWNLTIQNLREQFVERFNLLFKQDSAKGDDTISAPFYLQASLSGDKINIGWIGTIA